MMRTSAGHLLHPTPRRCLYVSGARESAMAGLCGPDHMYARTRGASSTGFLSGQWRRSVRPRPDPDQSRQPDGRRRLLFLGLQSAGALEGSLHTGMMMIRLGTSDNLKKRTHDRKRLLSGRIIGRRSRKMPSDFSGIVGREKHQTRQQQAAGRRPSTTSLGRRSIARRTLCGLRRSGAEGAGRRS